MNYNTAWKLKHKLMQVMMGRQSEKKLTGRIEMDDAYIGGEKPGKRGRGSRNKIPFIAAVETTQDGRPLKIHLSRVRGFRSAVIARYAKSSLVSGSTVFSDGLCCFRAVKDAKCDHVAIVTGGGRKSAQNSTFKWVNPCLETSRILCRELFMLYEKHVPRYLAEFEYRFNRRFNLPKMIERLLFVALRTPPMPYRFLRMAEVYG
ncbi:MAG: IS1595 family transposase [Sedimenticola sp.]